MEEIDTVDMFSMLESGHEIFLHNHLVDIYEEPLYFGEDGDGDTTTQCEKRGILEVLYKYMYVFLFAGLILLWYDIARYGRTTLWLSPRFLFLFLLALLAVFGIGVYTWRLFYEGKVADPLKSPEWIDNSNTKQQ